MTDPIDPIEGEDPGEAAAAAAEAPILAAIAAAPASVRNTPEFRELEKAARKTARDAGNTARAASVARTEAEQVRQAAEAQRQASLEAQLTGILGEDGIAAFNELSELSETDPAAAARRFAELMLQASQAPAIDPAVAAAAAALTAAAQGVPPMPSGGVDPNAPLNPLASTDERAALRDDLTKVYTDTVDRNQSRSQRNRVTMKDRAAAFIAYLGASYLSEPDPDGLRRR